MTLRMRNQFVVSARAAGGERRHALALFVHVREQDVAFFNRSDDDADGGESKGESVSYVEHVLELLDSDADFEALVRDLDALRPSGGDPAKSSKSAAAAKHAASALVQLQWRAVVEPSHHSVGNVLETTRRARSECFRSPEQQTKKSAAGKQQRNASESEEEEVYAGGMFAPLPLRRLAVEVWLYPPQVALPSTGDRLPSDDRSVTDFFVHVDGDDGGAAA